MPDDIDRILSWPRETRSEDETRRLVEHRAGLHREMFALVDRAERFGRNLTIEEQQRYDQLRDEFDRLAIEVPSHR